MRYTRFEDLPVWNTAIDLAVQVYTLTERLQFRRRRSLRDQIERAAVSVSNNIAEGFERGTNNELCHSSTSHVAPRAKCVRCCAYWSDFRRFANCGPTLRR